MLFGTYFNRIHVKQIIFYEKIYAGTRKSLFLNLIDAVYLRNTKKGHDSDAQLCISIGCQGMLRCVPKSFNQSK